MACLFPSKFSFPCKPNALCTLGKYFPSRLLVSWGTKYIHRSPNFCVISLTDWLTNDVLSMVIFSVLETKSSWYWGVGRTLGENDWGCSWEFLNWNSKYPYKIPGVFFKRVWLPRFLALKDTVCLQNPPSLLHPWDLDSPILLRSRPFSHMVPINSNLVEPQKNNFKLEPRTSSRTLK